jgi:hypothetical protein
MFVAVMLAAAASASADTVRVVVDRALVWTQSDGAGTIMNEMVKGQRAEVVRRVGDWYEIVASPSSGSSNRRTGFIHFSQVELEPGNALSPRFSPPPRVPVRSVRNRPPFARVFSIDAGYRVGIGNLTRSFTAFTDTFAEAGSIATNFGKRSGFTLDALYAEPLWGSFGVGLGGDYYFGSHPSAVEAQVPHPFFFNRLRTATFETDALSGHDAAVHIPVVWMPPPIRKLRILVFGGPTIFRVSQTVVTNVVLDEQYPYDMVTITGVRTADRTSTLFGFNVGGDVSHFFTPPTRNVRGRSAPAGRGHLTGVGVSVRYSRARLKFDNDGGVTTQGSAGGLSVTGGLRFRF